MLPISNLAITYALLLVDCSLQDNHSNFFGVFFVITDIYYLVLWNNARTGTANSYVHIDLMSCQKINFPLTPTSKRYFSCLYTLHILNFVVFIEIWVSTCKSSYFPYFIHAAGYYGYICYNNFRISVYRFGTLPKVITYTLDASTCIYSLSLPSIHCFYPLYIFIHSAIRYNSFLSVIKSVKILSGWSK